MTSPPDWQSTVSTSDRPKHLSQESVSVNQCSYATDFYSEAGPVYSSKDPDLECKYVQPMSAKHIVLCGGWEMTGPESTIAH